MVEWLAASAKRSAAVELRLVGGVRVSDVAVAL